jgi:hypothetical protein
MQNPFHRIHWQLQQKKCVCSVSASAWWKKKSELSGKIPSLVKKALHHNRSKYIQR